MRVGIIGGGQLGLMLGLAGRELGIQCEFLDPSPAPPAQAAGPVTQAAFDDSAAIAALARRVDVVSYEFENVPVSALQPAAKICPVYPSSDALAVTQDRLTEKQLFESLGIPLAGWRAVDRRSDLDAAREALGLPFVLKTRRFGYDGKGQAVVRSPADFDEVWAALGAYPLVAEQWIAYDYEVSAIGARGKDGTTVCYPLTENLHTDGILRYSRAPVTSPTLESKATTYLTRLLERFDYVGVMALELFAVNDSLLANEYAPRVHNSGHWTIEGTTASQFTNHLLAVSGQTPRAPDLRGHAGMLNLIGRIPDTARHVPEDAAVLHDYGKSPRDGRKVGHMTLLARDATTRDAELASLGETVTGLAPGFGTRQWRGQGQCG